MINWYTLASPGHPNQGSLRRLAGSQATCTPRCQTEWSWWQKIAFVGVPLTCKHSETPLNGAIFPLNRVIMGLYHSSGTDEGDFLPPTPFGLAMGSFRRFAGRIGGFYELFASQTFG